MVSKDEQRRKAREFLRTFARRCDWVVVDTETTGASQQTDDICELSILTADGYPLIDSLVKPYNEISEGAQNVHGIAPEDVAGAPTMGDFQFVDTLFQRVPVLIYNRDFDGAVIANSFRYSGIEVDRDRWDLRCVMEAFAMGYGEWDDYHGSYSWVKLEEAVRRRDIETDDVTLHRAKGDAELTRRLVRSFEKEAKEAAQEPA